MQSACRRSSANSVAGQTGNCGANRQVQPVGRKKCQGPFLAFVFVYPSESFGKTQNLTKKPPFCKWVGPEFRNGRGGEIDSLRSGLRPDRHYVPIAHLRSTSSLRRTPDLPEALARSGRSAGFRFLGWNDGQNDAPDACSTFLRLDRPLPPYGLRTGSKNPVVRHQPGTTIPR